MQDNYVYMQGKYVDMQRNKRYKYDISFKEIFFMTKIPFKSPYLTS